MKKNRHKEFCLKLVRLKDEAGRLGLFRTMHAMDHAVKEVGWEMAESAAKKAEGTGITRTVFVIAPERKYFAAGIRERFESTHVLPKHLAITAAELGCTRYFFTPNEDAMRGRTCQAVEY